MANAPNPGSPNPEQEPQQPTPRRRSRRRVWRRLGLGVGIVTLVGLAAGVRWVLVFIDEDLSPLVANALTETLDRPVQVGDVERFSLWGLRIGESTVPAIEGDRDEAKIEAIDVRFNVLDVLLTRKLKLDVTLIRPSLFLDQTEDGTWVRIPPQQEEKEQPIKVELSHIKIEDATAVLEPRSRPSNTDQPSANAASPETTTAETTTAETTTEFTTTSTDKSATVSVGESTGETSTELTEKFTTETSTEVTGESAGESAAGTASTQPPPPYRMAINSINGNASLRNDNKDISFDVTGLPVKGGDFRVKGEVLLETQQIRLVTQGQNLYGPDISSLLPLPLDLQAGQLWGNLELTFLEGAIESINGTARFQDAIATITGVPSQFNQANGRLRFQGKQINLEDVRTVYGQIPAQASGSIHLEDGYNLTAQVRGVDAAKVLSTFALNVPVAISGPFDADLRLTGALTEPTINGTARNVGRVRADRVDLATVQTRFNLTTERLLFETIEAIPTSGGRVDGGGQVTFGDGGGLDFAFAARDLPGDALALPYGLNASSVELGRLAADVQVAGTFSNFQTTIQWRAPEATYAGQGVLLIAGDQIRLQDTNLRVAGGNVTAEATSIGGQWQALVQATGVRMNELSADLQGLFSGRVRLSGNLANLSPRAIRAEGTALLSEGVPQLPRPITAAFRWLGDRIELDSTARGFSARGYVLAQLEGTPGITGLNLDVQLQDYALNALPVALPPQVQLAGAADFSGQVRGTLTAPAVTGQLRLNRLVVNDLTFERLLAGNVRYTGGQGLDVNLTGQRDRIAVRLDGQYRPLSFYVQQGDAIAQGQGNGQRLLAQIENFPLEALNIAPAAEQGLGRIGGLVNGNFDINVANLSNPSLVGEVAIARPALGYISGDRFVGRISYANGSGTLSGGEFTIGESLYRLAGSFSPGPTPQVVGRVNIERGRVEDILTALQWFDLADFQRGISTPTYNTAADLDLVGVNVMGDTVINQLRRYTEVVTLRNQLRRDRLQAEIVPELSTLTGDFSGDIEIANSAQDGFSLNFNIAGNDWNWDTAYRVEDVVAIGSLENGVLTLFPVRLQTGDRFLAFSGQVGGAQQSGQLQVQNVPIEPIRNLINLPVDLTGDLNATATLSGSLLNPQVLGELDTAGATLNNTPVQEARVLFGYNNARLSFGGRVVVNDPEPLQITGSIPYAFQFMDTDPNREGINLLPTIQLTDEISLDVNVRNEGLGLLNILTRQQVVWESGEGNVDVQVSGTLQRPIATGTAEFSNARFSSQALPEPLTDVTGQIDFNIDQIQVNSLSGRFSNGQVAVAGTLPIFAAAQSAASIDTPLTISLEGLNLDYKLPSRQDLYNGEVDGQVIITGAALAPRIGGEIILSNGRVFIPDAQPVVVSGTETETAAASDVFTPPQFDNLLITLGDRLLVTKVPILNFVVTGALNINGTLDDIRPDGTVALRSGQLNIYTTTFSLARGHNSQAVFTPDNGLVPYIDVQLITSVPEVSRNSFDAAPPFASNEVTDRPITDFGSLQTVRVQASVNGLATDIFQNLELTSSPRRSQNEIIGLLGGGFVDTLGQGNGVLAIANLASSALLTNIQTLVSNALGLSEFRLFPTTITSEENRTSSFGIAAELGFDITSNISVSALQILTDDSVPTQFNLRYRLSDEFLLRGSTNLSGDDRAVLEFETRF